MPKFHFSFFLFTFLITSLIPGKITAQEGVVTIRQDKDIEALLRLKKKLTNFNLIIKFISTVAIAMGLKKHVRNLEILFQTGQLI